MEYAGSGSQMYCGFERVKPVLEREPFSRQAIVEPDRFERAGDDVDLLFRQLH